MIFYANRMLFRLAFSLLISNAFRCICIIDRKKGCVIMKKILAIGNSFSEDATRYLHQIAEADGSASKIANLIIGGCPLEKHFRNLCGNLPAYSFTFNGESTGLSVSIQTMLLSDNWDYITLQQVSHQAPYYNTYQPYLSEISKKIRYYQPKAKLIIHQK